MAIYRYKATFPFSKVFFREYEIDGDITLFALNKFLTDDLSFAPDQMICFRGIGADGKVKSIYGLFDMGSGTIDGVSLESTLRKGEDSILYVFDIRRNHYIVLTFEEVAQQKPHASYPRLVAERGRAPEQFAASYANMDVLESAESEDFDDSDDDSGDSMEDAGGDMEE